MFHLIVAFIISFNAKVITSSLLEGKIFHGVPVPLRSVRFMASLRINAIHFGGGALISDSYILTAAECIETIRIHGGDNFANTTVLLGTSFRSGPGVVINVKNVDHHDQYNPIYPWETSAFDVGLILLEHPVQETNLIRKITIPDSITTNESENFVYGWGSEEHIYTDDTSLDVTMSSALNMMGVNLIPNHVCRNIYENITFDMERQLCGLGWENSSLAEGDFGSPLTSSLGLIGIATRVLISKPYPLSYSLFVKAIGLDDYIKTAKVRLNDRTLHSITRKRTDEECLANSSKRQRDVHHY